MKMRFLDTLLTLILAAQFSIAADTYLPQQYGKQSIYYSVVQKALFDVDELLQNIGIKVYACRVQNSLAPKEYRGVGPCLFDSIRYNFKEKKPSTIYVWMLNSQGQYLPPLKLEWKNTHKSWFGFSYEFLFMAFENQLRWFVKGETNLQVAEAFCRQPNVPDRDLGNFIGNISITIPTDRRLDEYFNFGIIKQIQTDKLDLKVRTPSYIDKKRTYQILSQYQNKRGDTVELALFTNFNIIQRREFCMNGHLEFKRPTVPVTGAMP